MSKLSYISWVLHGIGKCCNIRMLLKLPHLQILFKKTYNGCFNTSHVFSASSNDAHLMKAIDCVIPQSSTYTLYLSVVLKNTLKPSWYLCGLDAYTVCFGVCIRRYGCALSCLSLIAVS